MNIEIAEKIVECVKQCDIQLKEIENIIENIEDPEERKSMRRKLGEIVGSIYVEILRPIELEYPSLTI